MNMRCRMTDAVGVGRVGGAEAPPEFGSATQDGPGPEALDRLLGMFVHDRSASVLEQIGRLREAQGLVRQERVQLACRQPLDRLGLHQLGTSIHGLAEQAEVLILAMVQRGGAEALVGVVEDIFDSLRDAERLVDIALRRGRL
jgi:hypothetical protein